MTCQNSHPKGAVAGHLTVPGAGGLGQHSPKAQQSHSSEGHRRINKSVFGFTKSIRAQEAENTHIKGKHW